MSIYDAAMKYIAQGTPTIVFGGEEYGTGSSRDWAAKGTQLLGVKAVVAKSFERIHRSNLVGMGVLPLQFKGLDSVDTLGIKGDETYDITGLDGEIRPQQDVTLVIRRKDGSQREVKVLLRIDTPIEVDYYRHGGILPYVLRELGRGGLTGREHSAQTGRRLQSKKGGAAFLARPTRAAGSRFHAGKTPDAVIHPQGFDFGFVKVPGNTPASGSTSVFRRPQASGGSKAATSS